jgi:magnesium chelatase family protein
VTGASPPVGNSGHAWPESLLTINLSPTTLPKTSSHFDLAFRARSAAGGFTAPGLLARSATC